MIRYGIPQGRNDHNVVTRLSSSLLRSTSYLVLNRQPIIILVRKTLCDPRNIKISLTSSLTTAVSNEKCRKREERGAADDSGYEKSASSLDR